jgi:hypothetical protein
MDFADCLDLTRKTGVRELFAKFAGSAMRRCHAIPRSRDWIFSG